MNNKTKQIIKNLMYIISMFILLLLLLLLLMINSYFYPRYLDNVENIKIKFMNCEYWKNNQIPENLTSSQKWKIITTIGECKIIDKKNFLEENLNDNGIFQYHFEYRSLMHRKKLVEDQASFYLRELRKK